MGVRIRALLSANDNEGKIILHGSMGNNVSGVIYSRGDWFTMECHYPASGFACLCCFVKNGQRQAFEFPEMFREEILISSRTARSRLNTFAARINMNNFLRIDQNLQDVPLYRITQIVGFHD